MKTDIDFEWTRGNLYECIEVGGEIVIKQTGKNDRNGQHLELHPQLYMRFANLDPTEDECLRFAATWGLLRTPARVGASEPLKDWQKEVKKLRSTMHALNVDSDRYPGKGPGGTVRTEGFARIKMKMTSIDVFLLSGPSNERGKNDGRPALVFQPKTLIDAMYLQVAKFTAGDGSLQVCRQCGEWFERGAAGSPRKDAVFCGAPCKNRFHYVERTRQ